MASLVSPGVQISVIDETSGGLAPTGTVPFILLATAQDKTTPSNTYASLTSANTAGELVILTSQNDLLNSFGAPNFITSAGTPVNGSQLNEYGLQAAYSALGITNGAYVMRADIDLNALNGNLTPVSAPPPTGTYWFDTTASSFGLSVFNAATQTFSSILPSNTSGSGALFVITEESQTNGAGQPAVTLGKAGDFAIVATESHNIVYNKVATSDTTQIWAPVGTQTWSSIVPVVVGNVASPTANGTIGLNGTNVTLAGNINSIVSSINTANIAGVSAAELSQRLNIYSTNGNAVVVTGNVTTQVGISVGTYNAPVLAEGPSTSVPQWNKTDTTPRPTGSVWFNTTPVNGGANIVINMYNGTTGTWVAQSTPIYATDAAVNFALDPIGGGINIPAGTLYAQSPSFDINNGGYTGLCDFEFFVRQTGNTSVTSSQANVAFTAGSTFSVEVSTSGNADFLGPFTITLGSGGTSTFVTAFNTASIPYVTASTNIAGDIVLTHSRGGSFILTDGTNLPLTAAGFPLSSNDNLLVSNWLTLTYQVSTTAPTVDPANGTLWYYDDATQFDIMINDGSIWRGYRTVTANNEARGYNLTVTDPNGPIVSASQPVTQSNGTPLVYGDLWVNTSAPLIEPVISRFQSVNGANAWVLINNTDHVSSNGIVFADARWSTTGAVDPVTTPLPTIVSLLTSNYVDSDAPQAVLYPRGTLLFNTRRSGMNVKVFQTNYFASTVPQPAILNSWVTASGNNESGVAYLGAAAQRQMVVTALTSAINSSQDLLDPTNTFNLMVCPGYPELNTALVSINADLQQTTFVIGESPMNVPATSTALSDWANNTAGSPVDDTQGLVTRDDYMGVYYPAGLTTSLAGNNIVMPSTYMALNVIINNDFIAFPWFAPAGTRRGLVSNVTSLGYLDDECDFNTTSVNSGLQGVLYEAGVNPIVNLPGTGITVYGQKTTTQNGSALDRINVSRLIVYLRQQLNLIAQSYVFEQIDSVTMQNITAQMTSFLNGVVTQRGLYDFTVVCDASINTPATIDQNILYVDIAIQPVMAAEFIYIPITVQNTSSIANG
jgi:hypothetical protein